MKLVKKVKTELKKVQNKEEIAKGKDMLNDIFKSLKSMSKTIIGSKDKNSSKKVNGLKVSLLENETKDSSKRRNPKIEKYSETNLSSLTRRRTSDNLPIYTAEELNIGKGGDTELCPFDCDCCF